MAVLTVSAVVAFAVVTATPLTPLKNLWKPLKNLSKPLKTSENLSKPLKNLWKPSLSETLSEADFLSEGLSPVAPILLPLKLSPNLGP